MADAVLNPHAPHDLPYFITAPGETDALMVATAIFLFCAVVAFGVFYFRLHSLPEHIAHRTDKVQMEIVSILCLIALFTHEHIFWIIGLVLAFIDLPDFGTPLRRIAGSVARIAGQPPEEPAESPRETPAGAGHHDPADEQPSEAKGAKPAEGAAAAPKKPAAPAAAKKERSHV